MTNGIKVMVNEYLPPNTIVVSPDLYVQLKAASEGNLDAYHKQRMCDLSELVKQVQSLLGTRLKVSP